MSTHRIYHAPPERTKLTTERDDRPSVTTERDERRQRAQKAEDLRAEGCIYPMPTVAEVVAAGYAAARWDDIKRERDEFVAKFNADPAFRAEAQRRAFRELLET